MFMIFKTKLILLCKKEKKEKKPSSSSASLVTEELNVMQVTQAGF